MSDAKRFMCIRVLEEDCETETPTHVRVVAEIDYDALGAERDRLAAALNNLYALVQGECPRLLDDDHHDEMVRGASVPVRKPDRQTFIRVHPSPEMRIEAAFVELKEEGEHYLVLPAMVQELPGEVVLKLLLTAITRQGSLFLWPIRIPDETGRLDDWNRSAAELGAIAEKRWIRVVANRHIGAYEAYEATGEIPEPVWPALEFKEILKLAFRDRLIDRPDHPVISRLRGRR